MELRAAMLVFLASRRYRICMEQRITCTKCGGPFDRHGNKGRSGQCKKCMNARTKVWRENNREKQREYERRYRHRNLELYNERQRAWRSAHPKAMSIYKRRCNLKTQYGLTMAQYEAMVASQSGLCAICSNGPSKSARNKMNLVVDHAHDGSRRVRGLLCDTCNRALGLLRDSSDVLRKAAAYLDRNKS